MAPRESAAQVVVPKGEDHKERIRRHKVRPVTYRGTSLIRNGPLLGPCSRTMPKALL